MHIPSDHLPSWSQTFDPALNEMAVCTPKDSSSPSCRSNDSRSSASRSVDGSGFDRISEWVLTNAMGGFAMGTIAGVSTRRYHAMLCASLTPPVNRVVMLSAIDEYLCVKGAGYEGSDLELRLSGFQFAGHEEPPTDHPHLVRFTKHFDRCEWVYQATTDSGSITITKALIVMDQHSACRVEYKIESKFDPQSRVEFELRPLVAMRDFHELNNPNSISASDFNCSILERQSQTSDDSEQVSSIQIARDGFGALLDIDGLGLECSVNPTLWQNLRYHADGLRGQSDTEDLCNPCVFSASIGADQSCSFAIEASVGVVQENEERTRLDFAGASKSKQDRIRSSIDHALSIAGDPTDPDLRETIARLALASDDFVVTRLFENSESTSILAGYPWFSDWGRDTMIALPGLLLTTGRFDEAHATLATFAKARLHGLIPNRFDDRAGASHYNTVDASLWFVHACHEWTIATGKELDQELLDACDDILNSYIVGTINAIGLDINDGLITAGDANTQLTWMDALREGVAFTPRHGKAVEINALWIQALECRLRFTGKITESNRDQYTRLALQARDSMESKMSRGPDRGLVDCLTPEIGVRTPRWMRSTELRPNQAFACSLEFVGLEHSMVKDSLICVENSLLVPVGLRTLDPKISEYCPHYTGSMTDRDKAYHNGTAWPWLLGSYCEGLMRADNFSPSACQRAISIMMQMATKMNSDSVGQLFEIYDAEPDAHRQHAPQGCPAQAWSIAETLRVLVMASKRV
jgi:predicted glycogen debranching enzyme